MGVGKRTSRTYPRGWLILAGFALEIAAAALPVGWVRTVGSLSGSGLVAMNFVSATRRQKLLTVVAFVALLVFKLIYVAPRDFLANDVSPVPLLPIAEVDAMVVPGGEPMIVHPANESSGGIVTACFYYEGGVVAAAHPCDFPDSRWKLCLTCLASGLVGGVPTFEGSTPYGIVISGVRCPDGSRSPLPIAGPQDIHVGQAATTLSAVEAEREVEVLGYTQRKEGQFLVFRMLVSGQKITSGMSGTPLVQGGRLIAFVAGVPALDFSSHRIGLARLAADVYAETAGFR